MGLSSRPLPRLGSLPAPVRYIAGPVGFALLYFGVTQLSLALVAPGGIATVWPVSGLYLGVLLVVSKRSWPGLAIAALLGSVATNLVAGTPVSNSIAFAFPNAVEGILAAAAVERLAGGRIDLTRGRHLVALLAGSALAAGLAALSGALAASRALDASFAETWIQWAAADYAGMIAAAPLVLGGLSRPRLPARPRAIQAVLLLLGIAGATLVVFTADPGADVRGALPAALAMPFLLWLGWSYGPRAVATAGLGFAVAGGYFTAHELGPFSRADVDTAAGVLGFQVFLAIALTAALAAAAVAAGRRRLADSLETVTAERAELQEKLLQLERTHSAVRAELQRSEADRERLGGSLARAEREGSRLREQLAHLNAERRALERQLATRTEERDSARAQGARLADEVDRRAEQERKLKRERDGLLMRHREAEERLATAGARLEQIQRRLDEQTREVERTREALGGMEREAHELRNQLNAKTREVQQAKEYARKLLEERDELREWRGLAEKELVTAAARREELESRLAEEHQEADRLRQRVEAEAHETERLREALETAAREADALRGQVYSQSSELDVKARELEAQARELGRARAERDHLAGELRDSEATRDERDRLVLELRESEAARAHATQALDELRARLAEMTQATETLAAPRNGRSPAASEDVLASHRPMALLDADGRIEWANAALSALVGLPAARLEGFGLPELVHETEAADVEAGLRRFAEGNLGRVSARQRLLRGHGAPIEVRLSLSALRHSDGSRDFLLDVEANAAVQPGPPALAVVSG